MRVLRSARAYTFTPMRGCSSTSIRLRSTPIHVVLFTLLIFGSSAMRAHAQSGPVIDVMVVYTAAAATAPGYHQDIRRDIQNAFDQTNAAYRASGVRQRLKPVYIGQVDYSESGNALTDVTRLTINFIGNVHALRDQHNADLVVLWVRDLGPNVCGMAADILGDGGPSTVSHSFESRAFAVVTRDCAISNLSFAHELGHLMGARHDWFVDSADNRPYTFNHGFVNSQQRARTVMAYNNECAFFNIFPPCVRIPFFSNLIERLPPQITPQGIPEGQFHAADNAKTLNLTADTVANFRPQARRYVFQFGTNFRTPIDIPFTTIVTSTSTSNGQTSNTTTGPGTGAMVVYNSPTRFDSSNLVYSPLMCRLPPDRWVSKHHDWSLSEPPQPHPSSGCTGTTSQRAWRGTFDLDSAGTITATNNFTDQADYSCGSVSVGLGEFNGTTSDESTYIIDLNHGGGSFSQEIRQTGNTRLTGPFVPPVNEVNFTTATTGSASWPAEAVVPPALPGAFLVEIPPVGVDEQFDLPEECRIN